MSKIIPAAEAPGVLRSSSSSRASAIYKNLEAEPYVRHERAVAFVRHYDSPLRQIRGFLRTVFFHEPHRIRGFR